MIIRAWSRSCLMGVLCNQFVSPVSLGGESTLAAETRVACLRKVSLMASINFDHGDRWRGRIKSRSFPPGTGLPLRAQPRLYSQQVCLRRKHHYRKGARAVRSKW